MPRTSRRTAACALLALALAACGGGDTDVATPSTAPATTSSSPSPTTTGDGEPTTPAPSGSEAVAVYYLQDTTNGPRLYREFHERPSSGEPVRDAVEALFEVPADDPDYDSLWSADAEVLSVEVEGGTATVDLSEAAADGSAGSAFEVASVQQLVHTVTAADPGVERVQLLVEGESRDTLWGAADVREPVARAPQAEVLGPVWVLTPTEGGTVARGAQFGGVATVFEATVSWQWLQDGAVVAEGFSTASEGAPGRGEWNATVDVPPGDYELKAFESSAEDGSETFLDTKTVTVTA